MTASRLNERQLFHGGDIPAGAAERTISCTKPFKIAIFLNTRRTVVLMFWWITAALRRFGYLPQVVQEVIDSTHAQLSDLKRSDTVARVHLLVDLLLCTEAFGLGINIQDMCMVIHWGSPHDRDREIQEAGRAGRSGEQVGHIMFVAGPLSTLLGHSPIGLQSAERGQRQLTSAAASAYGGCRQHDLNSYLDTPGLGSAPARATEDRHCCDNCTYANQQNNGDFMAFDPILAFTVLYVVRSLSVASEYRPTLGRVLDCIKGNVKGVNILSKAGLAGLGGFGASMSRRYWETLLLNLFHDAWISLSVLQPNESNFPPVFVLTEKALVLLRVHSLPIPVGEPTPDIRVYMPAFVANTLPGPLPTPNETIFKILEVVPLVALAGAFSEADATEKQNKKELAARHRKVQEIVVDTKGRIAVLANAQSVLPVFLASDELIQRIISNGTSTATTMLGDWKNLAPIRSYLGRNHALRGQVVHELSVACRAARKRRSSLEQLCAMSEQDINEQLAARSAANYVAPIGARALALAKLFFVHLTSESESTKAELVADLNFLKNNGVRLNTSGNKAQLVALLRNSAALVGINKLAGETGIIVPELASLPSVLEVGGAALDQVLRQGAMLCTRLGANVSWTNRAGYVHLLSQSGVHVGSRELQALAKILHAQILLFETGAEPLSFGLDSAAQVEFLFSQTMAPSGQPMPGHFKRQYRTPTGLQVVNVRGTGDCGYFVAATYADATLLQCEREDGRPVDPLMLEREDTVAAQLRRQVCQELIGDFWDSIPESGNLVSD